MSTRCVDGGFYCARPEDVERGSARYMPLAYVVAFAGGGAKDVTVRFAVFSHVPQEPMHM